MTSQIENLTFCLSYIILTPLPTLKSGYHYYRSNMALIQPQCILSDLTIIPILLGPIGKSRQRRDDQPLGAVSFRRRVPGLQLVRLDVVEASERLRLPAAAAVVRRDRGQRQVSWRGCS